MAFSLAAGDAGLVVKRHLSGDQPKSRSNLLKPSPSEQPFMSAWLQRVVAMCQKRSADKNLFCRIPTRRDSDNYVFSFAFTNTQITDPRHAEREMSPSSCRSTRNTARGRLWVSSSAWNAASAC